MIHHIKIHPIHYKNVADGVKTFEVRVNDRDYKSGDLVSMSYYDPNEPEETQESLGHPPLVFTIGTVLPISSERVVFSLLPTSESTLDEIAKVETLRRLKKYENNKSKTAKSLGITVKTLYNRLELYQIQANIEECANEEIGDLL